MKLTIKKLKELIKDLPDEMTVVVDGYERGITNTKGTSVTNLYEYDDSECSVYGKYINKNDQFFESHKKELATVAFYLSRFDINETR